MDLTCTAQLPGAITHLSSIMVSQESKRIAFLCHYRMEQAWCIGRQYNGCVEFAVLQAYICLKAQLETVKDDHSKVFIFTQALYGV